MGTQQGQENHREQMCVWKLMVCKGRKEERKEGKVNWRNSFAGGCIDGWKYMETLGCGEWSSAEYC